MNKIRLRLHEIQEQLKNGKISKDKKTQLISEAKHLIPIENFDHQKHVIQDMVDDKYSEKKVWDHCQAEIDLLDHFLNENERLKSEALSIEASGGHNRKELQNVIVTLTDQGFELVKRRKTFKDLQNFHCKNYEPNASSTQPSKANTKNNVTSNSDFDPRKEIIYSWFTELLADHPVPLAFDLLGKKIEGQGLKKSDYYKTDDPYNFNRAYTKHREKKNKERNPE